MVRALWLSLVLMLFTVSAGAAATVTQTFDIDVDGTDEAFIALEIAAFDPALGNLESILLLFSGSVDAEGAFANTSAVQRTATIQRLFQLSFAGQTLSERRIDQTQLIPARSQINFGVDAAELITPREEIEPAFAAFSPLAEGGTLIVTQSLSAEGGTAIQTLSTFTAITGELSVDFTFDEADDTAVVPLPTSAALLLFGFSALGLYKRPRKYRQQR